MKRIFCAIVLMFLSISGAWADVEINAENFPDENFRSYVSKKFDKNNDGQLSEAEISSVTQMNVGVEHIVTLEGIEYFTALERLSCLLNQLVVLDVSQNIALTYLDCSNNQLTVLDVSQNAALTYLDCSNNELTRLDVSQCTALTTLHCHNNQLTEYE